MQNNNAVIYARYSSEQQKEGYSIQAQIRACINYAKQNGLVIVKHYIDEALSASSKTENRTQFLRLMEDAKLKEFGFVIVHKLDRFSRSKYDHAIYKMHLAKHNVQRLSSTEYIDNTPQGSLMETMIEGLSEYYARNLANETMKGLMEVARQCKHTGGYAPLGYNVDPSTKKYVINKKEAQIIKKAFKMFNAGYGYGKIVEALQGVLTRHGKKLSENSIHHILKNEKYTGVYIYNKQASKTINGTRNGKSHKPTSEQIIIPGGMPQIISEEVFCITKEKLEKNKQNSGGRNKRDSHTYLLSHIAVCGLCGTRMYGAGQKDKIYYYQCRAQKKLHTCNMKLARAENIEEVVKSYFKQVFTTKNINELIEWLRANYKTIANSKTKQLLELKEQLKQVDETIQKVINLLIDTPSQELKNKLLDFETKKTGLKMKIKKHSQKFNENAFDLENLKSYFARVQAFDTLQREEQKALIDNYIEYVEIYPEENKERKIIIKTVLDQKLGLTPNNHLQENAKVEYYGGERGIRTPGPFRNH